MRPKLSKQEKAILLFIADGFTDAEIAAAMFIGERTVRRHIIGLYVKLSATNRPNAVHRAWTLGVLPNTWQ